MKFLAATLSFGVLVLFLHDANATSVQEQCRDAEDEMACVDKFLDDEGLEDKSNNIPAAASKRLATEPPFQPRNRVAADNHELVSRCLEAVPGKLCSNSQHDEKPVLSCPADAYVKTDQFSTSPCRGKELSGGKVKYSVYADEKGIHIRGGILFKPDSGISLRREQELLNQAKACLPNIRDLWGRYGIDMQIQVASQNYGAMSSRDSIEVKMIDAKDRSDQYTYFFGGKYGNKNKFCLMMTHEIGHNLGLPDEYFDEECPDRKLAKGSGKIASIMENQNHGWELIDFMPRHIASIISPLCPDEMQRIGGLPLAGYRQSPGYRSRLPAGIN